MPDDEEKQELELLSECGVERLALKRDLSGETEGDLRGEREHLKTLHILERDLEDMRVVSNRLVHRLTSQQRSLHAVETICVFSLLIAGAALYVDSADRSLGLVIDLPRAVPAFVAFVAAVTLAVVSRDFYKNADAPGRDGYAMSAFYANRGQAYRAATAALFAGAAAAMYAADPSWNVQNVVMGIGVLIAIAAIVVPPLRHAPKSGSPEATPRAGQA